jgi:hypothetical protein
MSPSPLLFAVAAAGYLLTGAWLEGAHRLAGAPYPGNAAGVALREAAAPFLTPARDQLVATLVRPRAAPRTPAAGPDFS